MRIFFPIFLLSCSLCQAAEIRSGWYLLSTSNETTGTNEIARVFTNSVAAKLNRVYWSSNSLYIATEFTNSLPKVEPSQWWHPTDLVLNYATNNNIDPWIWYSPWGSKTTNGAGIELFVYPNWPQVSQAGFTNQNTICFSRQEARDVELSLILQAVDHWPGFKGVHLEEPGLWTSAPYCYCSNCVSFFASNLLAKRTNQYTIWNTDFVSRLRTALNARGKGLEANGGGGGSETTDARILGRAWSNWCGAGLLSGYAPQVYSTNPLAYQLSVSNVVRVAYGTPIVAGIVQVGGVNTNTPATVALEIQAARDAGAAGFSLFRLTDLTNDYTAAVAGTYVDPAPPTITWATPAAITYGTALGGAQLNATASVPGTFVYSPLAGTLLNAGNGQTLSVTFTPTDPIHFSSGAATVTINVAAATPSIVWANPSDITYGTALGDAQLNASAGVPGTFVYSPPGDAVLNAGNDQALSVAFTPTDLANYSTASATARINVSPATPNLAWTNPADITYRTALSDVQLNASASIPGAFVYSPPAGTVLNAGNDQALSVTFTPTDLANYSTASATARINVSPATPNLAWTNPADITYGTALSDVQLNASASIPGAFVYSPPAGTVLNAGNDQALSVTFTPTDLANYSTASATARINVSPATPNLAWTNPADITYGTALSDVQLNASASIPGAFVYSPPAGTVLNAGNDQALSVTFTPTDLANYSTASATARINVSPATPNLAWTNPADIIYGTALSDVQLNASASIPGTFVYSPPAGTVLNAADNQTLSVTFTPADAVTYGPATATVTINVLKAAPELSWATPADITYGTALTSSQLNANAGVPGTFTYTPAAGAVLEAGNSTLAASFTPTDAVNYSAASMTLNIAVRKAALTVTPANQSRAYGQANPTLAGTITGAVASDNLSASYSTTATTASPVGAYAITASLNDPANRAANYTITYQPGTLSITRALLTVAANNLSKVYGQSVPALTYTISGFVNGDTTKILKGAPTLNTTATATSPVGSYPINMTQGTLTASNYSFALVNGALAINRASTSTSPSSLQVKVGSASATLNAIVAAASPSTATINEGTVTFVVKNKTGTVMQSVTSPTVARGSASVTINPGSWPSGAYSITATYNPAATNPNFNASTGSATLTKR